MVAKLNRYIESSNECTTLSRSFNFVTNNLNEPRTRIEEDTILTLHPDTGKILSSWGKGKFYMPHGLTIDSEGNTYVTDVGLHQVMRVST